MEKVQAYWSWKNCSFDALLISLEIFVILFFGLKSKYGYNANSP